MPKIVDHEARRAEVLDATWRVIGEKGLEGATVREIARVAGVSNGVLAHYFTSKNDILIQAHRLAYERAFRRAAARTSELDPAETVRQMLLEALPLDDERRLEALIDVSYMGRALTDETLNSVRAESVAVARAWWLDAMTQTRDAGLLAGGADLDGIVAEIFIFIDGVSIQAVLYPESMTAKLQHRLAATFLDRIFS